MFHVCRVTVRADINLPLLMQHNMMEEVAAAEREEQQRNGPCEFVVGFVLVGVCL